MKPGLTCIFLLLSCLELRAQWLVAGQVVGEDSEPIAGATLSAGENRQVSTDEQGYFSLQLGEQSAAIVVRHLGFFPLRILTDTVPFREGRAQLRIQMAPVTTMLPEIAISGRPIETVFREHYNTFLIDYGFAGKDLLLLVREKKKYYLRLVSDSGAELSGLQLPDDRPALLHLSCLGNFHVAGDRWAWEIACNGKQLDTLPRYPVGAFHELIEPCVLREGDNYFFRKAGALRQAVQYWCIDAEQNRRLLVSIRDQVAEQLLMRQYRSILAAYMRTLNTIDQGEILAGNTLLTDPDQLLKPENLLKMAESNELVAAIGYFDLLATDSVYAPLLKIGNKIGVFDHVNDVLLLYDTALRGDTAVAIEYHRRPGWRKQLIVDAVLDRVYGRFSGRNGALLLKEIDPATGRVCREYAPEVAPYLSERFKMRNGYLYFIGQPQVNVPDRQLYRINLFAFGK